MILVTFSHGAAAPEPGLSRPDGVVPVRRVLPDAPPTVAGLLGRLDDLGDRLRSTLADIDRDPAAATADGRLLAAAQVRLHAPMGERVLVIGTGANFREHLAEMGEPAPKRPAWFVQNPNSVIGPEEPIRLPAGAPDHVDFEGEVGVVIGRAGHRIRAENAADHIAGYTLVNDVSARDALAAVSAASTAVQGRWAWTDMLLGKQYPTFGPMGPGVLTADEVAGPETLRLSTRLNGTLMQDACLDDLATDVPHLIEFLSGYFPLRPGDVITTGTPSGVGVSRDPQVFLRPGDRVEIGLDGLGTLGNPVLGPEAPAA